MMRWRRLVPVLLLGAATALAQGGCTAPSKGALVLAISTNMRTPKDINVVSVFITTNSVVKFDYLGRVLPDGTVALPATLAVVEPDDPNAQVRIRVIAFQEQKARVLRDVLTTVPHQQTSLLRLPLNFLDDNSGSGMLPDDFVPLGKKGAPEGETAFDPDEIASACDFGKGLTSINGVCVSATVDSAQLEAYDQTEVYGDAGLMPSGAPSSCFDVGQCFVGAVPVAVGDTQNCTTLVPSGIDPATMNLALVTPSTGVCLAAGCFVPLDNDDANGWTVAGGTIRMIPGICAKIAQGAQLYATSGGCATKTVDEPVCEPTTPAQVDSGSTTATCDGNYVITCMGNATCGGGSASIVVAGAQATLSIPQDHDGSSGNPMVVPGTVDPSTCVATFSAPPDAGGGCDGGIVSVTVDLTQGTTSGFPCTNIVSDGSDSIGTCVQTTLSCTVAPGMFDGGSPFGADASTGPDATAVGPDAASGGSMVSGNVNGISVAPKDQAATAGSITGTDGQESVMGIVITDTPGACAVDQQAIAGGDQKAGSTQLALALASSGSTPITPGTYPINNASNGGPGSLVAGQTWAFAELTQMSASCVLQPNTVTNSYPDSQAVTGTITISQITSTTLSGAFNLTFNQGSLTGAFNAPLCSGLNLQKLFTASSPTPGPDTNGICYHDISGDGGTPDGSSPPPRDGSPDGPPVDGGGGSDGGMGPSDGAVGPSDSSGGAPDSSQPPPSEASVPSDGAAVTDSTVDSGGDATTAGDDGGGSPPDASGPGCFLIPAGAQAWYRAEGDSTDLLGGTPASWVGTAGYGPGKVGAQAFSFSGASYLTAPVASASSTGTVEGWVLASPTDSNYNVFGFGSGPLTDGLVALGQGSTGMWGPELLYNGQTVVGPSATSAQWVHVAFTWDLTGVTGPGPSLSLYVNGQPTMAVPTMLDAGIPQMLLMGGDAAGNGDMTGMLDEITTYTTVLSSAQIASIYNAGALGKCQCSVSNECPANKPTCNASGFCQ